MKPSDRLATIDGLRGIAILLVVWFHEWQISWQPAPLPQLEFLPETGFVGVDLFFFISGFVISYPFLRARAVGTPQPGWKHFAYRRFIKIVPSYVLSIALLVAFGYARFASPARAISDIGAHLLFVHTWWNSTFGSINGVLWSLAVEVQFYLLFPVIWWCFRRNPLIAAAAMTSVALVYRIWAAHCCLRTFAPQMIDNVPAYLDIFAAGMVAAYVYFALDAHVKTGSQRVAATAVAFGGVALFWLLSRNLYDNRQLDMWSTAWQIVNRTWWGVAFLLIATGTLFAVRGWQQFVGNPLLIFFAAISFNWYLYHQAIARGLLAAHIPPFATRNAVDDPHWQVAFTLVAFGVTVAQAAAVTYLFERPLLAMDPARFHRWAVARGTT